MPKKKIKEAIEEAHEMADKAIDEAQEELEEAKQDLMTWLKKEYTLKTEHTFNRAELIVIGIGAVFTIATLLLL